MKAGAVLVVALLLAAGMVLIRTVRENKQAVAARHAAYLDPDADEPGLTPPDRSLPTDAGPSKVVAGIYVDRIWSCRSRK